MRESFIFYRSFFEAAKTLKTREKLKLLESICEYALNDIEMPLEGSAAGMFKLLKPQLDANTRKYENGCKGGRPRKNQNETKPKPNGNQTESKPKRNDNDNVNDNDNENGLGFETETITSLSPVQYLNSKIGSSYKETASTKKLLDELYRAGYAEIDLQNVIDRKCAEWGSSDMRSNLRPSVLFKLSKFEEYLHAPITIDFEKKQKQDASLSKMEKTLEEKKTALDELRSSLEGLSPGTNPDEWRSLKEAIAMTEDSISVMEQKLISAGRAREA